MSKFNQVLLVNDNIIKEFWNDKIQNLSDEIPLDTCEPNKYTKSTMKSLRYVSAITSKLQDIDPIDNEELISKIKVSLPVVKEQNKRSKKESDDQKCRVTKLVVKKGVKKLWKGWIGLCIRIYNKTLDIIKKEHITKPNPLRDRLKNIFRSTIAKRRLPNTSLEYAVWDALEAYNAGNKTKLRTKNQLSMSIALDGNSVKDGFIYPTNTRAMIRKYKPFHKWVKNSKEFRDIQKPDGTYTKTKYKKLVNTKLDNYCYVGNLPDFRRVINRLTFKRGPYEFYLNTPIPLAERKQCDREIISLDPGVRSFMAFYDIESVGEIGKNTFIGIKRLQKKLDKLQSKIDKTKSSKKYYSKCKMKKAAHRLRKKLKNKIENLHWKTAKFLTRYKYIILPEFGVKSIVAKLKSKHIRRSLLSLSHYEFRQKLIHKVRESQSMLFVCHEPYTSKTCTGCGEINNVGRKKVYSCDICDVVIDRDINGARNIMLRVLGGSPWSDSQ